MARFTYWQYGCRACQYTTPECTLPGTPYSHCPVCGGEWSMLAEAVHDSSEICSPAAHGTGFQLESQPALKAVARSKR